MEDNSNQGIDPLAQARKSMGFEPKPEAGSKESETKEEKLEPESPEGKTEEEEPKKEEEESNDESEEEDEEDKEENEPPKPPAKTKPSRSERQLFKRVGDVEKVLKDLPTQISSAITQALQTKNEGEAPTPTSKLQDLAKTLGEKFSSDPEAITELLKAAQELTLEELKTQGFLNKDIPKEVKEVVQTVKNEQAEREQTADFRNEWDALKPALQKQYPNASDSEIQQAYDEMFKIAHSPKGGIVVKNPETKQDEVHGYPLDYLLHQNRKLFDTILKVAPKAKSGEPARGEMRTAEETSQKPNIRQDSSREEVRRFLATRPKDDYDGIEALPTH